MWSRFSKTRKPRDRACPEGEADLVLVGAGKGRDTQVGGRGSSREARETQGQVWVITALRGQVVRGRGPLELSAYPS